MCFRVPSWKVIRKEMWSLEALDLTLSPSEIKWVCRAYSVSLGWDLPICLLAKMFKMLPEPSPHSSTSLWIETLLKYHRWQRSRHFSYCKIKLLSNVCSYPPFSFEARAEKWGVHMKSRACMCVQGFPPGVVLVIVRMATGRTLRVRVSQPWKVHPLYSLSSSESRSSFNVF